MAEHYRTGRKIGWPWIRPPVVPPKNVRVVLADGSVIPIECVYVGWVDKSHRWDAVIPLGVPAESLSIDVLPGKTSVCVRLAVR